MQEDSGLPLTDDDEGLLALLGEAAAAVRAALDRFTGWRAPGERPGQYALDLVADEAACGPLRAAGLAVLSEESGLTGAGGRGLQPAGPPLVIVDPVDGSTNASHGVPWFATSLCVVDADGPRLALVVNQANGVAYTAVRGRGARRDGDAILPSGCARLAEAVVGVSGLPAADPGWAQFRALGAASLDLCLVADGTLDGYRVAGRSTLAVWDYSGAALVCVEAGAAVAECDGRELLVRDDSPRRPVAAATPGLCQALLAAGI